MVFDRWMFSAKRAWQERWVRACLVTLAILLVGGSGFFVWKLLPLRHQAEGIITHYSVYLGIDAPQRLGGVAQREVRILDDVQAGGAHGGHRRSIIMGKPKVR